MSPAAYLDRHADDLTGLLRRLVTLPTVNPPGVQYDDITALLTRELRALGLIARRYTLSKAELRRHLPPEQRGYPRYNVLGQLAVRGAKKTVHFNA
ncbi:MAG: succinyl-diaminopimelate desuccinylase, partial [Verrucomicrobia bacterium]